MFVFYHIDLRTVEKMSFLRKVFKGKEEGKKSTASEDAIKKLRSTEESLKIKRNAMENKIKQEAAVAKSNCINNKQVALQALKHKKRFERNLTQIDGTISNVAQQRKSLESLKTNKNKKSDDGRK